MIENGDFRETHVDILSKYEPFLLHKTRFAGMRKMPCEVRWVVNLRLTGSATGLQALTCSSQTLWALAVGALIWQLILREEKLWSDGYLGNERRDAVIVFVIGGGGGVRVGWLYGRLLQLKMKTILNWAGGSDVHCCSLSTLVSQDRTVPRNH